MMTERDRELLSPGNNYCARCKTMYLHECNCNFLWPHGEWMDDAEMAFIKRSKMQKRAKNALKMALKNVDKVIEKLRRKRHGNT